MYFNYNKKIKIHSSKMIKMMALVGHKLIFRLNKNSNNNNRMLTKMKIK